MNLKRMITAVVGLPFVILLMLFGNESIFDVVIAVVAVVAMYEYANCIKKEAKFIGWVRLFIGYCNCFYARSFL